MFRNSLLRGGVLLVLPVIVLSVAITATTRFSERGAARATSQVASVEKATPGLLVNHSSSQLQLPEGVYSPKKTEAHVTSQIASAAHHDVHSSVEPAATTTLADMLYVTPGEQPEASIAPTGAGDVEFTHVTLRAGDKDVQVRSITLRQMGLAADRTLDTISAEVHDGEYLGNGRLNSDHTLTIKTELTIPAGTSKTVAIHADMYWDLDAYAGQMPMLAVTAIDASSPISGELPVKGSAQTVNTTIRIGGATAQLSQYDPGADTNRYILDKGIRFAGIRLTARSEEDITLGSVTWTQNGSAGPDDIENIVVDVNGTAYSVEREGRKYSTYFTPEIVIRKGESVDVYIQGNLTASGSNRTVKFDIRKPWDIGLRGNTYGFGVEAEAGSNTSTEGGICIHRNG